MKFDLIFTEKADEHYDAIENDPGKQRVFKDLRKALGYMETNLRHPSLNTHKYSALKGPGNEEIFESYVQQATPGAYRVFWYYGPRKNIITVIAILPHP